MEEPLQSLAEEWTRLALLKPAPIRHRVKDLSPVVERRDEVEVFLVLEGLHRRSGETQGNRHARGKNI